MGAALTQLAHPPAPHTRSATHLRGPGANELGAHPSQRRKQRSLQQAAQQRHIAHGPQLGEGELQAQGEQQQLHAQLGDRLDLQAGLR